MKILINTSNLNKGGAIQVAHSFINEIKNNTTHSFYIVLSNELKEQIKFELFPSNFKFYFYSIKINLLKAIVGYDSFLSKLEAKIKPDRVFSVFAPTYWRPQAIHIAGFAKPQYVYTDSPFFERLPKSRLLKLNFLKVFHMHNFKNFCDILISETEDVSSRLRKKFPNKKIYTVTNNYHQIFDTEQNWKKDIDLPDFSGFNILTVSANYPHKNLDIIPAVIEQLETKYPDFKFRFILTIKPEELKTTKKSLKDKIIFLGKVNIDQCPQLYQQANLMFLPTLLECFSASYAEAMRMNTPILTSDLSFARGLCGNAAKYINPICAEDIADNIVNIASQKLEQKKLVEAGKIQLTKFDTFSERANKYLTIIVNK